VTDGAIRIAGASVRYPGRREASLADVDLVVEPGERVGVTGRTGAGKSTLAFLASGFMPRVVRATVTGEATIDEVPATTTDPAALLGKVGIVFSTPANQLSASKQTVREELAFGLENLGVERDEMDAQIGAILDRLGIAHLVEREPFALSGGEQQRVAIASIVAMGTRVLVLDEPTAQLDPAGTAEVGDLLDELARDGTVILCVEHDPTILGRMDRVLLLDAGRMVGVDRPGITLGSAMAGSVGLPSPTMVRLAEAAGVDARSAFDTDAVVAGLRARRGPAATAAQPPRDGDAPAMPRWSSVRERPSVGLEVDDVAYRYPSGVEAVSGVSLRFEPGQAVAILGQNGSGKTTLVKHLNGLLRPDAGEVRIDGRSTAGDRVDQLAAIVGFVFQNPDDQLFERSVEREVGFGPRNLGFDAALTGRLVEMAMSATGLTGDRATNPYDLDLSRRKLVALASVLAMDPAVLVLDEPTTGQDPEGIQRIAAVARAWRDAGRTVIAITHDMEFAAANFDRVVLMRSGQIIADGPPDDVLAARNADLLASTGLRPPPAALVAAALGLPSVPADADALLATLSARG
jgi:energy-coupling factor transporter ATP-binding protein EcfA2